MLNAEIIAVGSEMLTPQKIDTNSLFLTDQLNALGVEVRRKAVVGDDRALLADTVREAMTHSEIVLLSGGLGPTVDDLTREAVADALGRSLSQREELLQALQERFRRLNRPMAQVNLQQTYLIDGAEAMANQRGTAPGQWIAHGKGVIALLPGPPHELKAMFVEQCLPRLTPLLPAQVIRVRHYRVAGMGESDLDQLIAPLYSKYTNPVTTILAAIGDIQIFLRARCGTAEEAERLLEEVGPPIEELLGDRIYSRNGESLEATVGRMLAERGATLSVAESCTGGLVGERITSVAGSSRYFVGGFLVYSDAMKTALLGIETSLLERETAVSEAAARAMAEGARARTGSTYALSVTGEAGPESATGAPVGTIYIGVAGPDGLSEVRHFQSGLDRTRVRALGAQYSLDLLRKLIR